jgi:hypothetical protein
MSDVFMGIDFDACLFWKLIRRLKPRSSRTYDNEQFDDSHGVPFALDKYFSDIYNAKEKSDYDQDFFRSIENLYSKLKCASSLSNVGFPGGPATVDEIQSIIRNLKCRKAPVLDLIQNEHEMAKITKSNQSLNSSRNYKSKTPIPGNTGGGIRCLGRVSIPCRPVTLAVSAVPLS